MKKTILLISFCAFAVCGFSQTVKVKNGNAVEVKPAAEAIEIPISKEELIAKKARLKLLETRLQSELAEITARLKDIEDVCEELGYK